MKTTHTPGPWHIEQHNKVVWQDSGGPGNTSYATSYPITLIVHEQLGDPRLRMCVAQLDNSSETEGNSRLIAAAPELLEALETLLDCSPCQNGCDPSDMTCASNLARAAIAKAKGQS